MKIESNNSSLIVSKNNLTFIQNILVVSTLTISIIGFIALTIFVVLGIYSTSFAIVFFIILFALVMVSLSLVISFFSKKIKKFDSLVKLEDLSNEYKIRDIIFEKEDKNFECNFLSKLLDSISLEEINAIDVQVDKDSFYLDDQVNLKSDLEKWALSKLNSIECLDYFSPLGDGNCLLSAFLNSGSIIQLFSNRITSLHQLRKEAVIFLKQNYLKDRICLSYVVNDFINCCLDNKLLKENYKLDFLFKKFNFIIESTNKFFTSLNFPNNKNITSFLKSRFSLKVTGLSFLEKFLDIYAKDGIYCGPAMIYALSKLYNITIFLFMSPNTLFIENMTRCAISDYKGGLIIFNPEAKSKNSIYLGLEGDHFISLTMIEK